MMNTLQTVRQAFVALTAAGVLYGGSAQATGSDYWQCLSTPPTPFDGTIVEAVVTTCAKTGQLCTLQNLVIAADLTGALSGPGPLTVYAPTDEAFEKIPGAVLAAIGSAPGVLTAVLKYHVSPGIKDPRKPLYPLEVKTLQGQTVFLDYDRGQGPQINQSTANCAGVRTTNGIVWIIDSVLLPQFK
jgi:uncharacterized surface protein with fasciclin (FAS1) repeats